MKVTNGVSSAACESKVSTTPATDAATQPAELQQRMALYGLTLVGGAVLAAAGSSPAQAQIKTVVPTSTLIATPGGPPIVLDFLNGTAGFNSDGASQPGQFALYIRSFTEVEGDPITFHSNTGFVKPGPRGSVVGSDGSAFRLKTGYAINSSDSFDRGRAEMFFSSYRQGTEEDFVVGPKIAAGPFDTFSTGYWGKKSPKDEGYLGFAFTFGDPQTDYGWAKITILPDVGIQLDSFAYDPTGSSIDAGDTGAPDANPLLLLVVGGAAAMAAYRTRRREAVTVH